jgi:hypothetical protein
MTGMSSEGWTMTFGNGEDEDEDEDEEDENFEEIK